MGSRACYLNSLRKSEPRIVNVIITEVANEAKLETLSTNPEDPSQVLRIGNGLSTEAKEGMISFLKKNLDVFTWKYEDMVGIDPRISCHHLNMNSSCTPHRQKRRALNPEKYKALKDEVGKLSRTGFIREAIYPKWISNPILILRKYNMKLNHLKCTFGMASGQFLGHIVNQRGIEANSVKITALLEMRATDKSLPFFNVLKQGKKFQWTSEYEETFQALKKHLGEAPIFSKPQPEESLLLYLAVSDVAINVVLVREENERQLPIYYVSKARLPAETRYPDMEKLALAHITASRKLRPYFQAHSIEVLTNFPLQQVLQRTNASGRLLKWAIELSEFDLLFRPRHAIKGQALADFVVECAKALEMEATMEPTEPPTWKLFVDGSPGEAGSGAGIVLESLKGHKLNCAVRFSFKASSNAAEYEVLLAGLRLAKKMQVRKLLASSDSQLIVNQFERFELIQVPLLENTHANALSKLVSSKDSELLKVVPIEYLSKPSIFGGEEVLWIEGTPLWMQPIIAYLKDQTLPTSRSEARKLRRRAAHFVLQEDMLYKRGFALPLLRCVGGEEATYIFREIHEEICGNHSGGTALAHKGRHSPLFSVRQRETVQQHENARIVRRTGDKKGFLNTSSPASKLTS
ncbi:uncharacterized protein LOC111374507 [Olea europaea var. sylvestris]|uniref:uncharacterized protein LOC111374507 n=1 Tax=Olea europaea var. sylvestris TaxID=158386 RepID=UPI000C1D45E9|nr:uncharacterized protein LOC111374507 [Olea europaea var. sylvestris]